MGLAGEIVGALVVVPPEFVAPVLDRPGELVVGALEVIEAIVVS